MARGLKSRRRGGLRADAARGLVLGGLAFVIAVFVSLPAQSAVQHLDSWIALGLVVLLVALGVLGDLIGIAAAAADEPSLHSMAAKRLPGARHALQLKRRADRVTSIGSDIVGDIAAAISAAAGAGVAARLAEENAWPTGAAVAVAIAAVAALTVGGKAFVKGLALRHANRILYLVGFVRRSVSWPRGKGRR